MPTVMFDGDLIARQSRLRPDAPGIVLADRTVTYGELERRTAAIALETLDRTTVQQAVVVVLLKDRSETALVTLAVQRAGCNVIALDAHDPFPHLASIADVVSPTLVIADPVTTATAEALAAHVSANSANSARSTGSTGSAGPCRVFTVDRPFDAAPTELGVLPPVDPDWPAVMVSSSGTSGRPKAIMHSHRSMFNVAQHLATSLGITPAERIGAVDSFAYAGVTGTTRAALFAGAPITYFNLKAEGIPAFVPWLQRHDVTFMRMQTAVLRALNEYGGHLRDTSLRTVSAAGESIFGQDAARFRSAFPATARFECRYSASEAYDIARRMFLPGDDIDDGPIRYTDIGPGVTIIRDDGSPADRGEIGEIAATNDAVGIGYWAERELTAERFDFAPGGPSTFRTGDLGRFADDGALELSGRRDTRVKIRGVNVELVAVEDVLLTHPDVVDCAVSTAERPGGGSTLIAYFVPKPGTFPGAGSLRRHVEEILPAASVPTKFFTIDALPRTGSGKVDRSRLKTVAGRSAASDISHDAEEASPPRNDTEREIAAKVAELLAINHLGVHDDFFAAGGDSLSAIELVAWVSSRFGVSLGVSGILEASTVAKLAERVTSRTARRGVLTLLADCPDPAGSIVLIAGAGDSSVAERTLALSIAKRHRVYGAQSGGIDDRRPAERSVVLYAKRIVRDLLAADPVGPYVIGGHSFGGVVAVEVLHRLHEAGHPASKLLILDTMPLAPRRARVRKFVHERAFGEERDRGLGPIDLARAARRSAMRGVRDRREVIKARHDARLHARLRKSHVYNVNLAATVWAPDRTVAAPTLLVRAAAGPTAALPLDDGWRRAIASELDVRWTPGTHSTLLYEPHVFAVADAICSWL